jgi:uncharacterized membrane protein YhaH (DUF805 family)
MRLVKLLFSFDGHLGRTSFWTGYLSGLVLVGLASVPISALVPWDALVLLGADGRPLLDAAGKVQIDYAAPGLLLPAVLFTALLTIATCFSFALMVKRCRDRGKSGWWSLLALIPFLGSLWLLVDLGIMQSKPTGGSARPRDPA